MKKRSCAKFYSGTKTFLVMRESKKWMSPITFNQCCQEVLKKRVDMGRGVHTPRSRKILIFSALRLKEQVVLVSKTDCKKDNVL